MQLEKYSIYFFYSLALLYLEEEEEKNYKEDFTIKNKLRINIFLILFNSRSH
jgi:hypothetical protein